MSAAPASATSAEALEVVDPLLVDAEPPVADAVRDGQVGAEVEELVLDPFQRRSHRVGDAVGKRDAEVRVQLVDRAERADPAVELRHAGAISERRLPGVAATRVDPRQAYGLVALPHHPA